ncbi:MAG: metallophosphatase family protein [Firmicutes bacterium]|nr:metallophosphatase family protein [Bacillota bacterium]
MGVYRIGVFSDVHGNAEALEAVLEDGRRRGVDEWLCAGDLVNHGPRPSEAVDMAVRSASVVVMGNRDREVGNDVDEAAMFVPAGRDPAVEREALRWTKTQLSERQNALLRGLPSIATEVRLGVRFAVFHSTPWSDEEYWETGVEANRRRLRDECPADVYCFGHTHRPSVMWDDGRVFLNAGSCGRPRDGDPRPCYAVVSLSRSHGGCPGSVAALKFVRVRYDLESVARDILEKGLPRGLAEALRVGA